MVTKSYIYGVRFEEGSADIPAGELTGIDQGISRWPGMPEHRVRVIGHALGEREEEGLALIRAEAIFRYLVDHGVDAARIDSLTTYKDAALKSQDPRQVDRFVLIEFYNPNLRTPNQIP